MCGQQEENYHQYFDTSLKKIHQEHQNLKTTLADVCQEVKQMKESLEENNKTLQTLLAKLNGDEDTPLWSLVP